MISDTTITTIVSGGIGIIGAVIGGGIMHYSTIYQAKIKKQEDLKKIKIEKLETLVSYITDIIFNVGIMQEVNKTNGMRDTHSIMKLLFGCKSHILFEFGNSEGINNTYSNFLNAVLAALSDFHNITEIQIQTKDDYIYILL